MDGSEAARHSRALRRCGVELKRLTTTVVGCSAGSDSLAKEQTKKDLQDERSHCPFSVRSLTFLLGGGEEATLLYEDCARQVERDQVLNDGLKRYDLSREEARVVCTRKFFRYADLIRDRDDKYAATLYRLLEQSDASVGMRWFIQHKLWIGTISSQGTEEQQRKWLAGSREANVIGCFGMTELGHSSHLRGAETVATFDQEADEFVLHSPTVTATKWWIGLAGQMATHCIVFANLVAKGQQCGIQLFIVPLRNLETGESLPGVSLGDLGHKSGRNGLDNGWIQFSGVRVPRENMLARWSKISRDGTFTKPPSPALAYGSTISERVGSVVGSYDSVGKALTIAIRYAAVRRQGSNNEKILDYQSHQERLIPHLASCYAAKFAFDRIEGVYRKMLDDLSRGDQDGFLGPLPDVHSTSCSLKAFVTWWATEALESCRRSMGGHAFSSYSGIPSLIGEFGVMTTGGGDNIVLAQQTAAYLLKTLRKIASGDTTNLGTSVKYLAEQESNVQEKLQVQTMEDLLNTDMHLRAFKSTARHLLKEVAINLQHGHEWNEVMCDAVEAVRAHTNYYLLESFVTAVSSVEDINLRKVLTQLCHLFALRTMQLRVGSFIEGGFMDVSHIKLVRDCVFKLCLSLRQVAVPLVDAMNFPDFALNSPLGRYDGEIYDAYLDAVKGSRDGMGVAPYWDSLVKPRVFSAKK